MDHKLLDADGAELCQDKFVKNVLKGLTKYRLGSAREAGFYR